MTDMISEINTWIYGIVSAIVIGIVGLVRRLITNEKQIELLKKEIAMREEYRVQRDDRLDSHMLEMRTDIKLLMKRGEP